MIDFQSISKWYGEKKAIDGLHFSIGEGEIVGLLGLNGAGKSTVLKILSTLILPSEGEARIAGFSVRSHPEDVRRHIGYLPDTPPLYEEMSVRSYLTFVANLKGVERPKVRGAVEAALAKVKLEGVAGKSLGELSHGFKQRVNIAQALVHDPKVLILDEPINGLDPVQISEMRDLILSLKSSHTVLLSSHILSEITKTCDRILVIDQGRLVAEGTEQSLKGQSDEHYEVELLIDHASPSEIESLQTLYASLEGVTNVAYERQSFKIKATRDVRSILARHTIESNVDLIGLKRKEAELETLFFQLVSGSKS